MRCHLKNDQMDNDTPTRKKRAQREYNLGFKLAVVERALKALSHSSPSKDHWLSAGSGVSSMAYQLIFGKSEMRVEFYMSRSQAAAIQWLVKHIILLEQALSGPLEKIKQELKYTDLNKELTQDAE